MSELKAKALQYLALQDRLNTLKSEIICLTGAEHTSYYDDIRVETKSVDVIDVQKLKQEHPEAYQNCTVGTGTILKVTKGGCHG